MNKILISAVVLLAVYQNMFEQNTNKSTYTNTHIRNFDIGCNEMFDIDTYKKGVDSIISAKLCRIVTTKLLSETLIKGKPIFKELVNTEISDITKHSSHSIKYNFSIIDGDKRQKHSLVELKYKNEKDAQSAFLLIEKVGKEKSGIPGLTYTNDYVELCENKIFWLNSSCAYSEETHKNFVSLFKKLNISVASKTLVCQCGEVICDRPD